MPHQAQPELLATCLLGQARCLWCLGRREEAGALLGLVGALGEGVMAAATQHGQGQGEQDHPVAAMVMQGLAR